MQSADLGSELAPLGTPMDGLVTDAMRSDCAMFWQAVHWKSRAVSFTRFCMLNGSRTAVKPSSLMRRMTFTMSVRTDKQCLQRTVMCLEAPSNPYHSTTSSVASSQVRCVPEHLADAGTRDHATASCSGS